MFVKCETDTSPPIRGYINVEHIVAIAYADAGRTYVVVSTGAKYVVKQPIENLARALGIGS